MTTTIKTPARLLIEDYFQKDSNITVCYYWEYRDNSSDPELSEINISSADVARCYASHFEGCSFDDYWENALYADRLNLIYVYLLDPVKGIAMQLAKAKLSEIEAYHAIQKAA